MKSSNAEASESELMRFHLLIKNNNTDAIAARDNFMKSSDKQQFHLDIMRICRSQGRPSTSSAGAAAALNASTVSTAPSAAAPRAVPAARQFGQPSAIDANAPCRLFVAKGSCKYGDKCKFSHNVAMNVVRNASSRDSILAPADSVTVTKTFVNVDTSVQTNSSAAVDGSLRASSEKKDRDKRSKRSKGSIKPISVDLINVAADESENAPVLVLVEESVEETAQLELLADVQPVQHLEEPNETDGNTRLRELLSSNSHNSPLLGGLGFGPTSGGLSKGLSALPPSKEDEMNIYKGSKLKGNLDMEYFLAGMPGFPSPGGRAHSFDYNQFDLSGRNGPASPREPSSIGSSLFHHGDNNSRSAMPINDMNKPINEYNRRSSQPPGFSEDPRIDEMERHRHILHQQYMWEQRQREGVQVHFGDADNSPKGGVLPPPGVGFHPVHGHEEGFIGQFHQSHGLDLRMPLHGNGPYVDPRAFGMPSYGMMAMHMHGASEYPPVDLVHAVHPYSPEFMGPPMMHPFINNGMSPMPHPHFMGIPGNGPPQYVVPSPHGGFVVVPMYVGLPPPQAQNEQMHTAGELDPRQLSQNDRPPQTEGIVDITESDSDPVELEASVVVDNSDSSFQKGSVGPVVNAVKTNMLKSLLGKPVEAAVAAATKGVNEVSFATAAHAPAVEKACDDKPDGDAVAVIKKTISTNYRISRQVKGAEMNICIKPNGQNFRGGIQKGRFVPQGGAAHCNQAMTVQWQLPEAFMEECKRDCASLVIGLHRFGSALNASSVVSKKLADSKGVVSVTISSGERCSRGEMFFFAPKAAGTYVFRLFDGASKESAVHTICSSSKFDVLISGRDVTTNLKYAYDLTRVQDSEIMGFISLRTGIIGMDSPGIPVNGDNPVDLLNKSVDQMFTAIERSNNSLIKVVEAKKLRSESIAEVDEPKAGDAIAATSAEHKARNLADKLNAECFDTMRVLRQSQIAMSMLLPEQTRCLIKHLDSFCPILLKFYGSEIELITARQEELGFIPALYFGHRTAEVNRLVPQLVDIISSSMQCHLRHLLPTREYFMQREETRSRIESILNHSGVSSNNRAIRLAVFGSSRNGFGSVGADLDMCIVKEDSSCDESGNGCSVIENIAAALSASGMLEVQARSTARIPIVLFCDALSGIDCDISFTNPLALRNTELLQLYSNIDPRVRQLAFIIKNWAKQRQINNPMDGTLGSYAYVLCLINFLQTRNPPVLPSLQQLAPDWSAVDGVGRLSDRPLPQRLENHPVEKSKTCDTYFYSSAVVSPGNGGWDVVQQELQHFASQNRQSCGELLIDFYAYYAWGFDYRHDVVSVRAGRTISKIDKCEYCSWPQNDRLTIEDPFETWYDVGHVLKGPQMDYFRRELARAYTILTRFSQQPASYLLSPNGASVLGGDIHKAVMAANGQNGFEVDVISVLCSKAPDPPFSYAAKQMQAEGSANNI